MAENKRFECNKGSRIIIDNETKLHYIMTLDWECSLVTKLLNRFVDENEQLKQELDEFKQPNCKKCMYYSVDGVGAYCMCENGLLNGAWEMFPFEWNYSNAKNCKEYEE